MTESDHGKAGPASQPSPPTYPAHPAVALGATLEPFVRGRRVALLGDSTTGLAELLADRGARLVHVYDPERGRVAESLARRAARDHRIGYAVFTEDLGVRDGAFDALIIPDLTAFTAPADAVRRARRLLGHGGIVVVGSPNADVEQRLLPRDPSRSAMLDYYELYDIVAVQFPHVRMFGQAPFVGYTVADFAPDGEPDVTVDTSLLVDAEQPEWYVAIASDRELDVDPYVVVGLPMAEVADATAPITEEPTTPRREAHSADRATITELTAQLAQANAELTKLRDANRADLQRRPVTSETQNLRVAELQRRGEETATQLRAAEKRAGDEHVRAERLAHEIRDLKDELARQRDRATRLNKQLEDERRARTKADVELGMIRGAGEYTDVRRREGEARAELAVMRERLAELEQEHAVTQRPPPMTAGAPHLTLEEPPTVLYDPTDPPTIDRRDVEPQFDVLRQRIGELEAQLAHEKARVIQLRAERDAAVRERDRAVLEKKSLSDELRRATSDRDAARKQRDEALAERDEAVEARDAVAMDGEALEKAHAELERRLAELEKAADAAVPAEEDLDRLERLLVERGREIARFQRELRESERVGRELVEELEALGAFGRRDGGRGGPTTDEGEPGAGDPEIRARLDMLADAAARREADLTAAGWKIAQLERQLRVAEKTEERTEDVVRSELEQALKSAQHELAQLRSSLAEQDVLVQQLDSAGADR